MKKNVNISDIKSRAEEYYRNGDFYCSEAIVKAIKDGFELPISDDAIAMASGFPVGMGGAGCTCGAVTGGVMALGMFFGRTAPKDPKVTTAMQLAKELHDTFQDRHKSLCCRVLTKGMELGSPTHMTQCIAFTGEVAGVVAEIVVREMEKSKKGLSKLKLFFNTENEVEVSGLHENSTIQDFFDAIDVFSVENPLPCETCKQNCCKGRFKINMDSIAAKKIAKGNMKRLVPKLYVDMGQNKLEVYMVAGKKCRHLNGLSRCLIYKERPASCRTYICIPKSACYKIIEASIVAELHQAMRAEYLDAVITDAATPLAAIEPAKILYQEIVDTSIAYGYNEYRELLIKDCVRADFAHSNVSPEEVQLFTEIMNRAEA